MQARAKLMPAWLACAALGGACGLADDGGREDSCFSPTQTPELVLDDRDVGCACSGSATRCVSTVYRDQPWKVTLACDGERWQRVEADECSGPVPEWVDCVVEGRRFPYMESVPDPFSCNTCLCEGGRLTTCTEIGCAEACPAGTSPGTSCAECGLTDLCNASETACLVECFSYMDCPDPAYPDCYDGVCKQVCG